MRKIFPVFLSVLSPLFSQVSVLTYHNDNARTGQNLNESVLLPAAISATTFGKLFVQSVDGYVYAQPLYVSNLTIPGQGVHNVVFVATEHDSVYAFDADTNMPALWHASFLGSGVTTVPNGDVGCGQIVPEIGITATPVIDPAAKTIFVVAMTKEVSGSTTSYVQRLHALDITTGAERAGSPVVIQASVAGTGQGGTTVTFVPKNYKARPGLMLLNGVVYTFWSSHCDIGLYNGWVIAYNASTLARTAIYNTTPDGNEASLWNSGAAPAADSGNNIYISTGNGSFNADTGGRNYGDSFVKLSTAGGGLLATDFFTPFNQASLSSTDADLGSGGVLVLPDGLGPSGHPNLLVGEGKEGKIYLVDRQSMGHFNSAGDHVVQEIPNANPGSFGMPAYFNNSIYYGGVNDKLKQYTLSAGLLSTSPTSQSALQYTYPGATPSVSALGPNYGILWAIQDNGQAALHAYNAANLAQEYYNSGATAGRDDPGAYVKFTVPTVANGKVYVGTQSTIGVYGLLSGLNTAVTPSSGSGSGTTFQLTYSDPAGAADITWAELAVNNVLTGVNGCYVLYYRPANSLYLYNDSLSAAFGPVVPGTRGQLQNSQCILDTGATSVTVSGNSIVVNAALTFLVGFPGTKNLYMLAQNNAGQNSGWQSRGTWTVAQPAPPTADSITPSSGTGTGATFQSVYSDAAGSNHLAWGELLINSSLSANNACWVLYYVPANVFFLYNDNETAALGPIAPGAAGTLQNSQCTFDASHSSVSIAGNSLTVTAALTFKAGFSGTKNLYIDSQDTAGQPSYWQLKGTWMVP